MVLAPPALGIEWQRQQFRKIDFVQADRSVEVARLRRKARRSSGTKCAGNAGGERRK
jgi:hypothetical protein